jgi:AraC family transcriptional activator of pobA
LKKFIQIPLHKQEASPTGGINVKHLDISFDERQLPDSIYHSVFDKHMDDHYSIGLVTKGSIIVHCDMEEITVTENSLFIMKPFQVHAVTHISAKSEGYFVGIESFLMPQQCRILFGNLSPKQQFLSIPAALQQTLLQTMHLFYTAHDEQNRYKHHILNGYFTAYVHHVASLYEAVDIQNNTQLNNQSAIIAAHFSTLLEQHSFVKQPSFFAQKLNITTAHLNHCVKTATGFTITHWLQDAMITEAKKQLYYTDNDSKQIAFALGYDDHAYFARLFKKLTGYTPLAFRKQFRE